MGEQVRRVRVSALVQYFYRPWQQIYTQGDLELFCLPVFTAREKFYVGRARAQLQFTCFIENQCMASAFTPQANGNL